MVRHITDRHSSRAKKTPSINSRYAGDMSEIQPKKTVDICVVTYKGRDLLGTLLASLSKLDVSDVRLRVVVVDNDSERSCESLAREFSAESTYSLDYFVEPKKGISFARNTALANLRGDYFAFLDDDEVVAPDWLQLMLSTMRRYDADFVFGPKVGAFPPGTPDWVKSHPVYVQTDLPTGTVIEIGNSGNVLGRTQVIEESGIKFDPAFANSGGEDTAFFYELHLRGYRQVWCAEASVEERIGKKRIKLSWMRRRAFRTGQSWYLIVIRRFPWWKRLSWLVAATGRLIIEALWLPLSRLVSFKSYSRALFNFCLHSGQLSMLFGEKFLYYEYSQKNYRSDE